MSEGISRAAVYRAQAEACRAQAVHADDPEIRDTYLNLAAQWERLARQVDQFESERKRG